MHESAPGSEPDRPPVTLPPGYRWASSLEGWLAVLEERAEELFRSGYSVGTDAPPVGSDLSGRGALGEIDLPGGRVLVRRFRHGGLLRSLTGERYLGPRRPFLELCLSEELRAGGFATPRVVAARARRRSPLGWELELLTERAEGARDLGFALADARAGKLTGARRRALLLASGDLVRRLHGAGFLHADLQPANLLAPAAAEGQDPGQPPELWVLDLDGSRWAHPLGEGERLANLGRLWRHVKRREATLGPALSRADRARFLRAYDPVRWRELGPALEASLGRRAALHQLGHWLDGRRRIARDPRAANS